MKIIGAVAYAARRVRLWATGTPQDGWDKALERARIAESLGLLDQHEWVVMYVNYRGEVRTYRLVPGPVRWGTSEWHPEPQYLIKCWDLDRSVVREFAQSDIRMIGDEFVGSAPVPEAAAPSGSVGDARERFAQVIHDHTCSYMGIVKWAEIIKHPHYRDGYAAKCAYGLADALLAAQQPAPKAQGDRCPDLERYDRGECCGGHCPAPQAPVADAAGVYPAYVPADLHGSAQLGWIAGYYGPQLPKGLAQRLIGLTYEWDKLLATLTPPQAARPGDGVGDLFKRLHVESIVREWCCGRLEPGALDSLIHVLQQRMARAQSVVSGFKTYEAAPVQADAAGDS